MSKADLLLKKAASFEKLALYSDRKAFLQAVAQTYDPNAFSPEEVQQWESQKQSKPGTVPPPPPDPGSPQFPTSGMGTGMTAPAPREQGKPAPAMKPINPQYQKLLGVTPDGVWGPETQKALEAYKAKINRPGLSDGVTLGLLLSSKS
jgi:hypothetical protein